MGEGDQGVGGWEDGVMLVEEACPCLKPSYRRQGLREKEPDAEEAVRGAKGRCSG